MEAKRRSNELVQQATEYMALGWSVIPLKEKDKRPCIEWTQYQDAQPDLDTVRGWFRDGRKNIGIVTGKASNIVVVDVDTAEGDRAIREYIPAPCLTPTVKTPHGQHLYFKHPGNGFVGNNARRIEGCDFRGDGGYVVAPPSIGTDGAIYSWSRHPARVKPMDLPSAYTKLVLTDTSSSSSSFYCNYTNYTNNTNIANGMPATLDFSEGMRDTNIFKVAACLKDGGMSWRNAEKVIEIIAKSCNPPFPIKQAMEKVKSAYSKQLPFERNLAAEIREWVSVTSGDFSVTECDKELEIVTKRDKANRRKVFQRLRETSEIEGVRNREGWYRRVESESEAIVWENADVSDTFDVEWPFRIEEFVTIYPKNIIIVAGASNAGKTAFLLNVAQKNVARHKINYFSSEMGPEELRLRIDKFNLPDELWKEIGFYDRSSKFADVIRPDGINIIDYLELTDNFFTVGGEIKDIFDRLDKGVAVIALQKKGGMDLARGGDFTLEKARLYLSMDSGKLKIVKAKNFAQKGVNPNGMEFKFKLVEGCKFIPV